MKKNLFLFGLLTALLVSACAPRPAEPVSFPGMGMGGGMMDRHHAPLPNAYAGLSNPVAADDASLERGAALYASYCATCHGDGGMGDGPAASSLNPAPAPIAHTSQMMADAYLFWRISTGGAQFNSAMPAWEETLDEQARWDLVNYMRALGAGTVQPGRGMGGASYDPALQAEHQAQMLAAAVEQGVLTQEEADTFAFVHDSVEAYRVEHPEIVNAETDATRREAAILDALVDAGVISAAQADAFNDIHDRLTASGLMQ